MNTELPISTPACKELESCHTQNKNKAEKTASQPDFLGQPKN